MTTGGALSVDLTFISCATKKNIKLSSQSQYFNGIVNIVVLWLGWFNDHKMPVKFFWDHIKNIKLRFLKDGAEPILE